MATITLNIKLIGLLKFGFVLLFTASNFVHFRVLKIYRKFFKFLKQTTYNHLLFQVQQVNWHFRRNRSNLIFELRCHTSSIKQCICHNWRYSLSILRLKIGVYINWNNFTFCQGQQVTPRDTNRGAILEIEVMIAIGPQLEIHTNCIKN